MADEFQLRHMIFTEIYGFMYFVFNIAWYYATPKQEDRLIYHILDWEAKTSTACLYFAMAIFILVPLFAFLHLLAYRCVAIATHSSSTVSVWLEPRAPAFVGENRVATRIVFFGGVQLVFSPREKRFAMENHNYY